jgi:hypothetical protein
VKPDTTFKLGKSAISKEEHDELMKSRRRPITQDPISRRREAPVDTPSDGATVVDQYVNEHLKGGQ